MRRWYFVCRLLLIPASRSVSRGWWCSPRVPLDVASAGSREDV